MTYSQLAKDRDHALAMAQRYSDEAEDLIKRHGQGIRPSWVSGDIGRAQAIADQHLAEARDIKRQMDKLAKEATT